MRIALGVEYDGAPFCGWQFQGHSPSVQEEVERGLSKVANGPVRVTCAGRTDTGVHATEQVIHFDAEVDRSMRSWVHGANANMPKTVAVLWATPVNDEFHARFSAVRRSYRYVICNRPVRPTFLAGRATWEYRPLEVEQMAAAGRYLVGEHDFSAYRGQGCQAKSPVRRIHRLEVSRCDELLFIDIEANAFLYHMVRNIAGVLMTIGAGERPAEWAQQVLELRDRSLGGVTSPPAGLYLTGVYYPERFILPQRQASSLIW